MAALAKDFGLKDEDEVNEDEVKTIERGIAGIAGQGSGSEESLSLFTAVVHDALLLKVSHA